MTERRYPFAKRFLGHLKTVNCHRYWMLSYCFRMGIPWQGLVHDLSKYSPTEFIEGIRYWTGTCSPIVTAKRYKPYSKAWMHHKGRNKHHYEYWMDNFDSGGNNVMMPFRYSLEMICDFLAAGRAYDGKRFTYESELNWWKDRQSKPIAMHPALQLFTTLCLTEMGDMGRTITKRQAKEFYRQAILKEGDAPCSQKRNS